MTAPRVFVSRAGGLGPAERTIAARWSDALADVGLEPVALTREEYRVPPWSQLRTLVRSCEGLVVLGFASRPTPWNHLEAGLGIMAGLPVLAASEEGSSDAVFGPETWGEGVTGVSLSVWEGSRPLAEPALRDWLSAVRSGQA